MSKDFVADIAEMHTKFGVNDAVNKLDAEKLHAYLAFRVRFLEEELTEIKTAKSAEDVTDGLLDLVVVALGTLNAFGVDAYKGWDEIHRANMSKVVGIKPSRPNPLGLPDLIKPEGWVGPDHTGNVGKLDQIPY